jgi:hypothetical protein
MGGRENAKQALRDKLIEHKQVDHPPRRRHARGQGLALARAARLRGCGKIESKLPRVAKCSSETLLRNGIRGRGGIK